MEDLVSMFCGDVLFRVLHEMPLRLCLVQSLFIDYCSHIDYELDGEEEIILEILKKGCVYVLNGKLYYQTEDETNHFTELIDSDSYLDSDSSADTKLRLEIFHKKKK